ncbi:carbohydrate kinase family protein [Jiangella rhizosphaerae]|uniref:Ribokinase n=1 Tax=Jiangella rhizosphaerae TaxID=2293569 RepID=A0A418KH83_9ACTN|nr:PfkB family carbohydrate kinase [Jiangella rhizosphaerae]RIQ11539.1 ribokinase [Jiangella rhizosphaerae]
MPLDVICVGVATVDTIAVVPEMPGADDRVVAEPFVTACGGPAATAAVALARLGARVGFCGVVGDDDAGRLVRAGFEREGVDTTWLRTVPGQPTTTSMVIAARSSGTRAIVTTPQYAPGPQAVPVDAAAWLHADQTGYRSALTAARAAAAAGARRPKLSVDAGNPIPGLDLDGVDLYVPTTAALAREFGTDDVDDGLRAAAKAGAGAVVATAGSTGSHVLDGDDVAVVAPFRVEVASTIGAGDVFHGALLAGLVAGGSLTEAARLANAVAALSCRALDGRSAIPNRAEADAFLLAETPDARPPRHDTGDTHDE